MAQGMISPVFDTEEERIKEQLAQADALRQVGLKGNTGSGYHGGKVFIVGNPLGNIASGLAGAFMGDRARTRQGELEQSKVAARDEWLGQMPTGVETQRYDPVSNPGTGPLAEGMEVPQSPRALANAMRQWAVKAPRGMEGVQGAAIQQQMLAPEKEADRAAQAEAAKVQLLLKAEEAKALQAERLAQQRQIAEMNIEGRKDMARLAASLRASGGDKSDKRIITTTDANGNPVQQVIDLSQMKPGDTLGKYVPPKSVSPAQAKKDTADADLSAKLDDALKSLEENPDAVGWKTLTPDLILQRAQPEGVGTRAKIGELGAAKAHELYGAAFSASEQKRANKFIPQNGDDYNTTKTKLQNMKALVEESRARRAQEKSGGTQLTVVRTGTRNGKKVQQMSDGSIREVE
jgi:hypothetical protein